MKSIDILANFEREINKIDDTFEKPATEDSLFWLNQTVNKFVKLRFNGDFVHKQGNEQTEKRRSDLYKLFTKASLNPISIQEDINRTEYTYNYPPDFLYELDEEAVINGSGGDYYTPIFECTLDSYMYRITNSLTDFHYRYGKARPLRIRTNSGAILMTDGNYTINEYTLGYIRKPNEITITNPQSEYEDFEDSTMYEIIKMAAQMYLENQESNRYKTISAEVATQE